MARRKLHELMPGEKPGWRKGPNWVPASGGQEKPFKTRTGRRLQYVWDTRSGDHAYLDLDTDMILSPEEARQALALDSVQPKVRKGAAKDPWDLTFQQVTGKPLPPKQVKKEGLAGPTSAQIRNRAEALKSNGVRGEQLTTALRREFGNEMQDSTEKAMYDIGEVVNRKTLARLVKEELFNFKFERLLTEGYEKHVNNILDDAGIGGYHWAYGTMHFGSAKIMEKAKQVLLQHKNEIYQLPPMTVDTNEAKGAEPASSTPASPDTAFPWGNRTLTPDQLKKLGKKEGTVKEAGENNAFILRIPANVYDGKYYDYRLVSVLVRDATTAQDATKWVNSHKNEVLAQIDKKRVPGGKRLVKAPVADNVFFKSSYSGQPTRIEKRDQNEAVGGNWKKDTTSGSYGAPIKSKCPSCGNPWSVDLGVANGMHFHGCLKCNKTFIPNAGVKEAGNKFQSIGSLGNKPPSDDTDIMPGEEEAERALKGENMSKCPHCGSTEAWDGSTCHYCGFKLPVKKEGTTGPRFADVQNRARILLQGGARRADVANQLAKEFPGANDMIKQAVYVAPTKEQFMGEALNRLRQYIRESIRQTLQEKWADGGEVKKLDKYGKAEQPLSALKSQAANLRDKEERSAADSKKLKQLNFAIRARTGWGKATENVQEGETMAQRRERGASAVANWLDARERAEKETKKQPKATTPKLKKEVAPKGWEGTVKAMKKHKDITNPWALANYMKNKGAHPHKESVSPKIREAIRNEIRKAIREASDYKPKGKLGSGERFKQLTKSLAAKSEGKVQEYTVRDPKALAASIGRKKYGKEKFQQMAAKGRKK